MRIEDVARIGIERGSRNTGRDQRAGAIDDVGAIGGIAGGVVGARQLDLPRAVRGLREREVDQAHADDGEGDGENAGGKRQPAAARLDHLLRRSLQAHGPARWRRHRRGNAWSEGGEGGHVPPLSAVRARREVLRRRSRRHRVRRTSPRGAGRYRWCRENAWPRRLAASAPSGASRPASQERSPRP